MDTTPKIRVILFDLGGVLLRLRDPIETFGLAISHSEFKQRWLESPSVRRFESGEIDTEQFARSIVKEARLPYDAREFIERFDSWPLDLYPETLSILDAIPRPYERALLSNINALHWQREEIEGSIARQLDRTFLSYETGHIKPDRAAFEQVWACYECGPENILFFDDSPANVEAAADFGLQGVLAVGTDDVRAELEARSIL